MGLFSWLFGEEEEAPPEPLVLGAKLQCVYGGHPSFLYVDSDNISINHLPEACVEDSKAFYHIQSFGTCYAGDTCDLLMELEEKWDNPEPQNKKVNGKEIITTKSVLTCKATGMTIKALTSGQDGIYANQLLLIKEMGEKYPGLLEILMDPNGSLYLNEGMYEKAIEFIEERMEKNGGSMEIVQMYGKDNLEGELILAALDRLMVDCDAKRFDRFMEGLETKAIQYGRETAEGWDKNYLNAAMIKLMREDSKATAERIATNGAYRFMEETKRYSAMAAEVMNNAAYMAVIYSAVLKAEVKGKTVSVEGGKGTGRVNNAPKIKDAKFNNGGRGSRDTGKPPVPGDSDFVGPLPTKNYGRLEIISNGKYSQSEINSARYLAENGNDVVLRPPVGTRAEGGTSDLIVNGITYDVYTPVTGNPSAIIRGITKKNTQAKGVVLDLSESSVVESDLGNILARVKGAIEKNGGTCKIEDIIVIPK